MDNEENELKELIKRLEAQTEHKSSNNELNDNKTIKEDVIEPVEKNNKTIKNTIIFIILLIIVCLFTGFYTWNINYTSETTSSGSVTRANYDKIQIGMSYNEVIKILGDCNTSQNVYGKLYCFWVPADNKGTATDIVSVYFVDGKVTDKNWQGMNETSSTEAGYISMSDIISGEIIDYSEDYPPYTDANSKNFKLLTIRRMKIKETVNNLECPDIVYTYEISGPQIGTINGQYAYTSLDKLLADICWVGVEYNYLKNTNVYEHLKTVSDSNDNQSNNSIQNTENEKYVPIEAKDNTGINGIYTNKAEADTNSEYSSITIQNGKIEWFAGSLIFQGTYIQENDRLLITYTNEYLWDGVPQNLSLTSQELIIESENKLIMPDTDRVFIKE